MQREGEAYEASTEGDCCGSIGAGIFSEVEGSFKSSSSSCFRTTGCAGASVAVACSVVGGVAVAVASLALDVLAFAPARPPARGRALPPLPLAFGGIVTEDLRGAEWSEVRGLNSKSLVLIDKVFQWVTMVAAVP